MSFTSLQFIIFFPVVFFAFYAVPKRYQWVLLLASSYYFYMCWKPEFIVLILLSTCIDYFSAQNIWRASSHSGKKFWLAVSVVTNLSLLFFFKYFNFFGENVNAIFKAISIPMSVPALDIILPVGISFYTFQTMSYTIEVYRGNIEPERHFGYFALFVTYFPQLVAGPIETPQSLLPQLRREHDFSYDDAVYGIKLMAWGFFKKLVVADTAALFVDKIYNNMSGDLNGIGIAIATFLFAMQVYCDFGGYSDIARGCARMMGVTLMKNFVSPYFFSRSIREYWSRNHISLSKWFTQYVYIPLGGGRCGVVRKYINNTIAFLLSGLWHGADWSFVVWGGLQSVYINIGDLLRRMTHREHLIPIKQPKLLAFCEIVVTCCLSCFSLIFFRANNITDGLIAARGIFGALFDLRASLASGWANGFGFGVNGGIGYYNLAVMLSSLLVLFVFDFANEKLDVIARTSRMPRVAQCGVYVVFMVYLLMSIQWFSGNSFIYFQF